jgi:hypothetical protein
MNVKIVTALTLFTVALSIFILVGSEVITPGMTASLNPAGGSLTLVQNQSPCSGSYYCAVSPSATLSAAHNIFGSFRTSFCLSGTVSGSNGFTISFVYANNGTPIRGAVGSGPPLPLSSLQGGTIGPGTYELLFGSSVAGVTVTEVSSWSVGPC